MSKYSDFLQRKQREYGKKFDASGLNPEFIPHFNSGDRVEITDTKYNYTRRGTIGITTGWKPCFLIMSRSNSRSSSDCISENDKVTAIIKRNY